MVNLSKFRSNKKILNEIIDFSYWYFYKYYGVNKKLTHNMSTWISVTIKFIVVSQKKQKKKNLSLCT